MSILDHNGNPIEKELTKREKVKSKIESLSQKIAWILGVMTILTLAVTNFSTLREFVFPKKLTVVEIRFLNESNYSILDTLDFKIRNASKEIVVIKKIKFNFKKVWIMHHFSDFSHTGMVSSAKYSLGGLNSLLKRNTNFNGVIFPGQLYTEEYPKSLEISLSQKIVSNDADRFYIGVTPPEYSFFAKFNMEIHFNEKEKILTDDYIHFFSDEVLGTLPTIEEIDSQSERNNKSSNKKGIERLQGLKDIFMHNSSVIDSIVALENSKCILTPKTRLVLKYIKEKN